MKPAGFTFTRLAAALSLGLALCVGGCGNPAQKEAYEQAFKLEEAFTSETAPDITTKYRQVIAMEPGSKWAEKAQARIEAVEARVVAEEHHKEVFHEHGID